MRMNDGSLEVRSITRSWLVVWVLAYGFGFAPMGQSGVFGGPGILPVIALQAGVIALASVGLAWRWAIWSTVIGVPSSFVAYWLVILFHFTVVELPPGLDTGLGGGIAGAGLGLGGWLALRGCNVWEHSRRVWIPLSAIAWALGTGAVRALFSWVDPHGYSKFQVLYELGLSDRWAAYINGCISALASGLVVGAITAIGINRLARSASGASASAAPTAKI